MRHLTPYRKNETSLSPVRGKGMGLLSKEVGRKGGLLVVVMPVGRKHIHINLSLKDFVN